MAKNVIYDANELYDILVNYNYFTREELDLVTDINGFSIETLNDCIYARFGYRDFEQFAEAEGLEGYFEEDEEDEDEDEDEEDEDEEEDETEQ